MFISQVHKYFKTYHDGPDWLWGLAYQLLIQSVQWAPFPGVKRSGLEADYSLPSTTEVLPLRLDVVMFNY
jgi:hypothetical protein